MGADEQELAGPWGWDISNDDFEDIIVADDADEFMELDHMPADDELIAGIASADMQVSLTAAFCCWFSWLRDHQQLCDTFASMQNPSHASQSMLTGPRERMHHCAGGSAHQGWSRLVNPAHLSSSQPRVLTANAPTCCTTGPGRGDPGADPGAAV